MWEFIANNIGTILAVLGSLSTGLLLVVIFVFGVPALVVLGNIIGFAKAVFNFLRTPVGQVVGIILLCGLCLFAGDTIGTRRQSAKCQEAERAAELASANRDIEIHKAATVMAEAARKGLAEQAAYLEQKVKDYEDELAKRPRAAACAATADDIRKLRAIAD